MGLFDEVRGMTIQEIREAEVVHIHGQHIAHAHTEEEWQNHQQPIENEKLLKRRNGPING